MRRNRSDAVTAIVGEGEKVEVGGGGGGCRKSEGFNAKARNGCETDVGLCSGNGPWVALLA